MWVFGRSVIFIHLDDAFLTNFFFPKQNMRLRRKTCHTLPHEYINAIVAFPYIGSAYSYFSATNTLPLCFW